jgi:hypothetical protein
MGAHLWASYRLGADVSALPPKACLEAPELCPQQRYTHAEWLKSLEKIDRDTHQDKTLYLIADNYAMHKHPTVQEWLAKHPRCVIHFTPTPAS